MSSNTPGKWSTSRHSRLFYTVDKNPAHPFSFSGASKAAERPRAPRWQGILLSPSAGTKFPIAWMTTTHDLTLLIYLLTTPCLHSVSETLSLLGGFEAPSFLPDSIDASGRRSEIQILGAFFFPSEAFSPPLHLPFSPSIEVSSWDGQTCARTARHFPPAIFGLSLWMLQFRDGWRAMSFSSLCVPPQPGELF